MNDNIDGKPPLSIVRDNMAGLKLYHVTVEIEGYVLATSERAARGELHELVVDADIQDSAYVDEVRTVANPIMGGWDEDCYCYGTRRGVDISLGDAREIIAERAIARVTTGEKS